MGRGSLAPAGGRRGAAAQGRRPPARHRRPRAPPAGRLGRGTEGGRVVGGPLCSFLATRLTESNKGIDSPPPWPNPETSRTSLSRGTTLVPPECRSGATPLPWRRRGRNRWTQRRRPPRPPPARRRRRGRRASGREARRGAPPTSPGGSHGSEGGSPRTGLWHKSQQITSHHWQAMLLRWLAGLVLWLDRFDTPLC